MVGGEREEDCVFRVSRVIETKHACIVPFLSA